VLATVLSGWSEYDPGSLESAARELGVGAAAAQAAAESLQSGDRRLVLVLAVGLVALAWFTLGAIRAFVLAYALAWQLGSTDPSRSARSPSTMGLRRRDARRGRTRLAARADRRSGAPRRARAFAATTAIALSRDVAPTTPGHQPRDLLPGAVLFAVGNQLVQVAVLVYFAPELGERQETYGASAPRRRCSSGSTS
jgi:uncharacterized BrkB/YihY/UPF0761 family membrane protein